MKVSLISYTPNAVDLLLFTKSTRLEMSPALMDEIRAWDPCKKTIELAAMARTNPGSWEFLDLVFMVEGVTRACTHQMVRTRQASYAQQSLRVVDASNAAVKSPEFGTEGQHAAWNDAVSTAMGAYRDLLDLGMPKEDARGVLPTNVLTNIVCKYNFRAFTDLVKARESLRAQGEYRDVVAAMKAEVLRVWPWSDTFFISPHSEAVRMIERVAKEIGVTTGAGPGWELAKAADLLRKAG